MPRGFSFNISWECLKSWADEVHNMGSIIWKMLFMKLSAVETIDKQTQGTFQSIGTTRKTSRFASQPCQVVTEFSIVRFNRKCVCLAFRDFISAQVIPEPLVGIKPIAVIPFCFGGLIDHLLNRFLRADPNHGPPQNAAGFAVDYSENVNSVFLSPIKVNNSSISASLTSSGSGVAGKASA